MMKFCSLFTFFCCTLSAFDYTPWFSPLWEIESEACYLFSHGQRVQSPEGDFEHLFNDHEFIFSLGTTLTPRWNIEADIAVVKLMHEKLLFQFFQLTTRRLWLDDVNGDPFTLTTNLSFLFTQKKILEEIVFPYHGYVNTEFQLGLGKEFIRCDSFSWNWRIYSLLGIGIAERGCPWLRAVAGIDKALSEKATLSFFCEYLKGFGDNNLDHNLPFPGYALIDHQSVFLFAKYSYHIGVLGSLNLLGFFNPYSRNFPEKVIGAGICLEIPFSL